MRSATRHIYRSIASQYEQDVIPFFGPLAESFIRSISFAKIGGHVLDVGTGTGIVPRLLAGQVQHVTGIDAVPEMIAVACSIARPPNIRYVVGDIHQPPLRPASFDFVIASFGLNLTQPRRVLGRIHKLLKPGGWLAVQEWGPIDPASQIIDDVFADFVTDPVAEMIAELLPAQTNWGDWLQDTDDYYDLLNVLGYINPDASESTPSTVKTSSIYRFIGCKAAWLPYQLTLATLDARLRTRLFDNLYTRLTPFIAPDGSFTWTPPLFRVTAQRPP